MPAQSTSLSSSSMRAAAVVIPSTTITAVNSSNNIGNSTSSPVTPNKQAIGPSTTSVIIGHRPRSGSAREQAVHAVEYYNSNVLRARVGAGLAGPRSSVNERHFLNNRNTSTATSVAQVGGAITSNGASARNGNSSVTSAATTRIYLNPEHLYRSNSSLELLHDSNSISNNHETSISNGGANGKGATNIITANISGNNNLRREYGSHGSIDALSSSAGTGEGTTTSENFFAMLQEYRPAVLGVVGTDQKTVFSKGNMNGTNLSSHQSNNINDSHNSEHRPTSPKPKTKLHKLWGPTVTSTGKNLNRQQYSNNSSSVTIEECSTLANNALTSSSAVHHHQQAQNMTSSISIYNQAATVLATHSASTSSADIEERQRRRAFAHYDCQSLTANLGYAAKLRGLLLARRRNTTTGASAASMMNTRSITPDADSGDEDYGDGQQNDLLENCPFFRNEIGREEEREVSLTRMHSSSTHLPATSSDYQRRAIHRPALACGVSILECLPKETLWKQTCPFQKGPRPIESVDHGARYFREYFHGEEHQNWFGMDEQLGPVAISVKKEKLPDSIVTDTLTSRFQYRMIIRTSELLTLRGSVLEDFVPNPRGVGKPVTTKEVLEYVAPEIQLNCLRLGVNSPQCEQQLIKLDEQGLTNKYKVGILYCQAGQSSEEDMYNNEEAGPAFREFLDTIGKRVRLKGFEHYKAGLDNKTDSTGTHSVYATYQDCEIMFHVSTMLPFTPNNRQQLLRKRHIGNDIVTIVFQEPGALPFTPKSIRSQFQHVFIIVRAVNPCSENTGYRVAISRSKEVPVFGPPIPNGAMFTKGKTFGDFLLAKVINAENAAHRSEKFATMATRTRQEYLKDLATNYCTTTIVDAGPKFSLFPSKKKEKPKPRFSGDSCQRGAFCWQVVLQDSGLSAAVDCFLGISTETFILIEECTRQIVFVTPTKSVLGWSTSGNSLRVYHHQGECVTINMRDSGERDEQLEVIERLRYVTNGCGALELSLRRNPMGQLGFHVQPDGVVTQVESSGQAWLAGLRQGYRLVEICKVAVATLSHDQMVDLLKTSAQVTVTIIESFSDHTPRRGCFLSNCKFNIINYENDYDSTTSAPINSTSAPESNNKNLKKSSNAQLQQPVANHRRRYERNFSPPRSSNSSGYGTGSSSRSFSIPNEHIRQITDMGTLTSSSSGHSHSSNDDRWYDIIENVVENSQQHVNQQQQQQQQQRNFQNHHQQAQQQQQSHQIHQQKSNGVTINSRHDVDHHPKLSASSSLPLSSSTNLRPLSIHDPTKVSSVSINDHHRPAPRMANVEYLITKAPSQSSSTSISSNNNSANSNQKGLHESPEYMLKGLTISNDNSSITDSNSLNNECHFPNNNNQKILEEEVGRMNISPQLRRSATTSNVQKMKSNSTATVLSSSSTSSSRNNSPRPQSEAISASVAAKLRPGVTNRNQAHLLQRNSVNYSTNNSLQEDLMKLINPDYLSSDDTVLITGGSNLKTTKNSIANSHSLGNISALSSSNFKTTTISEQMGDEFLLKSKSRSREAINLGQQNVPELKRSTTTDCKISIPLSENENSILSSTKGTTKTRKDNNTENEKLEVIFTTARPATVISSSTNSSNSSTTELKTVEENVLHISESTPHRRPGGSSTRKRYEHHASSQPLPLLPDPNDMDWSSLVDTATRAMMLQFQEEQRRYSSNIDEVLQQHQQRSQQHSSDNSTSEMMLVQNQNSSQLQHQHQQETYSNNEENSNGALPELQTHLSQLEDRILRETRRRKSLEHAVRRLTEENRRLQDESQAAVQQLRRFTEWFFQTIDKQS